jgi:hypothetical protein
VTCIQHHQHIGSHRAHNGGDGRVHFRVALWIGKGWARLAASLDQDVANIAHAPNANAKPGMLQGFTQLVQAQTGKSLTSDQAKVLITLAGAL